MKLYYCRGVHPRLAVAVARSMHVASRQTELESRVSKVLDGVPSRSAASRDVSVYGGLTLQGGTIEAALLPRQLYAN